VESPDFTMDELLRLLEEQCTPDGAGLSTGEIAEALGRSHNWVHRQLGKLAKRGILEVRFQSRTRLDGRSARVPVYSVHTAGLQNESPG